MKRAIVLSPSGSAIALVVFSTYHHGKSDQTQTDPLAKSQR
ncbi:hypothetical protein NIES2104_56940 [Leptolyngbya sp. NIES-2104]|nr:hypothetical protein NIES2104_56940 [Leptolyngbya sp. NIES-2104]